MEKSDENILSMIKAGQKRGLECLFDKYYETLCIISMKYTESADQAEDIVQELFIKIWEERRQLGIRDNLKSYLFTATRNNSIQWFRKNKKQCLFEEVELEAIEAIDNIEQFSRHELIEQVKKEIEQLPEKSRLVFESIFLHGMKYAEVAKEHKMSINTVKTHLSRTLKKLRRLPYHYFFM